MGAVLGIVLPIFATIALGFAAMRRGVFRPADLEVMQRFVMMFSLPALAFSAISQNAGLFSPVYLVGFAAGSLAALLVTRGLFLMRGASPARAIAGSLGAGFANSAFVGYPILALSHPDVARPALAMNMMVDTALTMPLILALTAAARPSQAERPAEVLVRAARDLVRRPLVIALIAGGAWVLTGWTLPDWVARFAGIVGSATAPLALVYIGGSLASRPARPGGNDALASAAAKLFLHPLLVMLSLALLALVGLGLPRELWAAAILSAAMPMAGIVAVLAAEAGEGPLGAAALLLSTLGSFVTLTVLLALV